MPRAFALMKPREEFDSLKLAWATGLFEGEGGVTASRSGREPILHVAQAGNAHTPPSVLVRFRDAVGGIGGIHGPGLRPPRQPKWAYHASGIEVVDYLIGLMDPWLGDVKREQARRVLDKARALRLGVRRSGNHFGRPLNTVCVRGHPYDEVYVDKNGVRHCMRCRRIRESERRERTRGVRDGLT